MPASRPQWKGYLKLSLVSCPIAIYPAVSAAERISFRQINRNTGNRLRQQLVDAVTGEAVDSSHRRRGYEVGDSSFLPVEDEELEVARQQAQARRPGAAPVQPPAPAPISEAPASRASAWHRLATLRLILDPSHLPFGGPAGVQRAARRMREGSPSAGLPSVCLGAASDQRLA